MHFQRRLVRHVLQQTVLGAGPVRRPERFVARAQRQLVAPPLHHVEALRVPQVRLQPAVLALAARVLALQVARLAAVLARRPLGGGRRAAALALLGDVRVAVAARQPLRVVRHGAAAHVPRQRLEDELRLVGMADGAEQRADLGDAIGGVAVGGQGVGQLDGTAEAGVVLDLGRGVAGGRGHCEAGGPNAWGTIIVGVAVWEMHDMFVFVRRRKAHGNVYVFFLWLKADVYRYGMWPAVVPT